MPGTARRTRVAKAGKRRARRPSQPRPLTTVKVPRSIDPVFRRAQEYVSRYFRKKLESPRRGTITISGERYILLRAASMSVEFFDLVTSLYQAQGPEQARLVASNLLFDVAHAIGKADARAFHEEMGVTDPIERLSAGPIHFSYAGWAFVHILPQSRPSPDEGYFLIYDHLYSFESDTWRRRGRHSRFPVCVMSAGYSSGWGEESFGLPLVSAEIECRAAGGRRCRFIMAPPSRIEAHLARHARRAPRAGRISAVASSVSVPEFFQRQRLEEELRRSHELLEQRVRERTAALTAAIDALRREVAERKRAEEARDEFLSVAAHELKTPLTSLRGFAQLLASSLGSGSSPNVERLTTGLQAIERQSEKLSWLVTQLLDVSRLEAGRLVLERRPTDVVPLVNQVLEAARAGSPHHALHLRAPDSAVVAVDPLRLEQVLTNLVDNAIKYSPDGGPVEVAIALGRLMLRIEVADRGLGIPAEHRDRIFDRFYRAHPEQRIGGLGLGLYISRQIVELHGGAIKVEHPEPGGTRMVVWVPVTPREA